VNRKKEIKKTNCLGS